MYHHSRHGDTRVPENYYFPCSPPTGHRSARVANIAESAVPPWVGSRGCGVLYMPLNPTQARLRWALTTTGVEDHLADLIVEGYSTRQIIEATAYARLIRARSVAAVVVKSLMRSWRYAKPSDDACQDAITFLGLETCDGVVRLFPKEAKG